GRACLPSSFVNCLLTRIDSPPSEYSASNGATHSQHGDNERRSCDPPFEGPLATFFSPVTAFLACMVLLIGCFSFVFCMVTERYWFGWISAPLIIASSAFLLIYFIPLVFSSSRHSESAPVFCGTTCPRPFF